MMKRTLPVLMIGIIFFFLSANASSAHATLISADPSPGGNYAASPSSVTLRFNERVEDSFYFVKAFDQTGKPVTMQKAVLQSDHKGLELPLPKLEAGLYTVSYKIISADGHPVSSSYTFALGQPGNMEGPGTNPANTGNVSRDQGSWGRMYGFFQSLAKMFYYLLLIGCTGSLLWKAVSASGQSDRDREWSGRLRFLGMAYGLSLLVWTIFTMRSYAITASPGEWLPFLTCTAAGLSLTAQAVVLALAFPFFSRSNVLPAAAGLAMLAAKSASGHLYGKLGIPGAFLDGLHLAAAALWAGGLLHLAFLLKHRSEDLPREALRFSKWALGSMAVLLAGGAVMTLLLLHELRLITVTLWGKLLLLKIVLVVLVWITGGYLRKRTGAPDPSVTRWKRVFVADLSLMFTILILVSVLTGLSPLPAAKPYAWHEPAEAFHLSAALSPNISGMNRFDAELRPAAAGIQPKSVRLLIKSKTLADFPPLEYELPATTDRDGASGVVGFRYGSDGVTLPFPGHWVLEVRVMDTNDDETVFRGETVIY